VLLTLIAIPIYRGHWDRVASAEAIALLGQAKNNVNEAFKVSGTLTGVGKGIVLPSEMTQVGNAYPWYAFVTHDGALGMFSKKYGSLIVLRPEVVDGKLNWACTGHPMKSLPEECPGQVEQH
jgi:hypothetical protein